MKHKKALSSVVTSLILILLVLAAIMIIWVVVKGLITEGTERIDFNTKCLEVNLKVNRFSCTTMPNGYSNCYNLVIERTDNAGELSGIMVGFKNATGNQIEIDVPGDLSSLTPVTLPRAGFTGLNNINLSNINSVFIIPYFKNEAGEKQLCVSARASKTN